MKILYDSQMFDAQIFGGITRYFVNLTSGLDQSPGISTKISVLFTKNHYLKNKVKTRLSPRIGEILFSSKKRISKFNKNYSKYCLLKNDFDLFHPTYFHPYFLKFLKKPFVITVHDMIYELYPEYFTSIDFTAQNKKKLIKEAAHIIAISQTTKDDLIRILNVPENKITVVYHGHTPIENCASFDLPLPEEYILFVGERNNYKNFVGFARGLSIVMQDNLRLKLICAGGAELTEIEKDQLEQLGILDRTIQYDITDDFLYWLYKGARIFVYPSLYEGFGLPILEAFESRCPVVLSNTPSFKEIAGDAAVYFDPKNSDSIAACIQSVLGDSDLRNDMISKGEIRLKKFTMEKCIEQTIEIYKKCIGNQL